MSATLLFTDVEDSTGLLAARGLEESARLIGGHVAMVERLVCEHGGAVASFTGDGVLALWSGERLPFAATARHALDAMAEIARAIVDANAADRARGRPGMRIRIGIHSGEVALCEAGGLGDSIVIGLAAHLAHRVEQSAKCRVGRREEVLVSVSDFTMHVVRQSPGAVEGPWDWTGVLGDRVATEVVPIAAMTSLHGSAKFGAVA